MLSQPEPDQRSSVSRFVRRLRTGDFPGVISPLLVPVRVISVMRNQSFNYINYDYNYLCFTHCKKFVLIPQKNNTGVSLTLANFFSGIYSIQFYLYSAITIQL